MMALPRILPPKVLIGAGLVALFGFCFVLFAYLTFPYDRLRDFIVLQIEYPEGPGGQRMASGISLQIEELSPSWLTGVNLTGVNLERAPTTPDGAPLKLAIDEATLRVGLFALLGGGLDASYDVAIGPGEIEGELEQSEEATSVDATLDNVNLAQLGVLDGLVGLPIRGRANGEIDVTVAKEMKDTNGSVGLTITGLKIGDGEAKLKIPGMADGFTVDQIDAGKLTIELDIKEGVAEIKKLEARGKDLELDGSGTIRLLQPLANSRLDLLLRLKMTDSYRNRNDRTQALFSLMDFNPQLKAARTDDGALQYRLSGGLTGSMRTSPAGRAPRPSPKR